MNFNIKVSSSRNTIDYLNNDESFEEIIDEYEAYSFTFSINIYHNNVKIGVINGRIFDENLILNNGEDMVDIADMYDGDVYEAIEFLTRSELYEEEIDENLIFNDPFLCYIETFYIKPKYRGKGIAKYMFRNLYDILLYSLMIHIRCFVIYPQPQIPTESGWKNLEDHKNEMKKLMIDVIKKEGYSQLGGNSGYYAINCMKKEDI